jgi:spoIIIJ-associated protein
MNAINDAREILEIMLRHLGYTAEVAIDDECEVPGLQVTVADAKAAIALTGKKGERLDDIQHLVNKLLHQKLPDAPRIRVDVNHFRGQKDDDFLNGIRRLADRVGATREPIKLDPMNSYQRRLVHNLFKDDSGIKTFSPEDDSRIKCITLLPGNA